MVSPEPPTVAYWMYWTSMPQTGVPATASRPCPVLVARRLAAKSVAVSEVMRGGGFCVSVPRAVLVLTVPRLEVPPPPQAASRQASERLASNRICLMESPL